MAAAFTDDDLRLVEAELWGRGELDWLLRPHQRQLYDKILAHLSAEAAIYACCVARRFGKTSVLLIIAVELCQRIKNFIVRFVAPQLKDAREITSEIITPILAPARRSDRPVWQGLNNLYLFRNGSKIHVNGANNGEEDSSRGRRADMCIVDEAGYIDRLEYLVGSVLLPQLVEENHIGKLILSSTPPETPAHPFQEYVEEARLAGRYTHLTLDDNTYLSDAVKAKIIEEAGGLNSTTYRREYGAEFVVESARAIAPEWGAVREACTVAPAKGLHYVHYDKYLGMDLGVVHYTVILYGYYDFHRAVLVIESEQSLKGPEVRSDVIAGMIRSTEKELWGEVKPYARIADNNCPILLNDLGAQHGVYVRPVVKDSLYAMVNDLRLWIKNKRILIAPECKMLLGCLDSAIWTLKRDKWDESKNYGHYDALAALMYLARSVDESHNPIPIGYGITPTNQWVNPAEMERKNLAKKMAKMAN